jgi:hypothetical protein
MDQLLLQPVRRLGVDERCRAGFGHTDGCPIEAAEIPPGFRRGPASCGGRNNEPGFIQRAAILDKILGRHLDGAPATRSARSRMHALARAECHHLARLRLDPTIPAGTVIKGTRDSSSSPAAKRKRWSAIWVSRARNWPQPVTRNPTTPSSLTAV